MDKNANGFPVVSYVSQFFFYSNKKNRNGEGDGGEDVKGKYLVEALFFRPLSNQ